MSETNEAEDEWFDDIRSRDNLELLLNMLQRPQYVYKMARACLVGKEPNNDPKQRSARTRRDNALKEIARMLDAYNHGNLWQIEVEEKAKWLAISQKITGERNE